MLLRELLKQIMPRAGTDEDVVQPLAKVDPSPVQAFVIPSSQNSAPEQPPETDANLPPEHAADLMMIRADEAPLAPALADEALAELPDEASPLVQEDMPALEPEQSDSAEPEAVLADPLSSDEANPSEEQAALSEQELAAPPEADLPQSAEPVEEVPEAEPASLAAPDVVEDHTAAASHVVEAATKPEPDDKQGELPLVASPPLSEIDPASMAFLTPEQTPQTESRKPQWSWFQGFMGRKDSDLPIAEPKTPFSIYVASMVINVLALAQSIVIMQVYDRIIPNRSYETLGMLIVLLTGVLALDLTLKSLRSWATGWSAARFNYAASVMAMERLLKAPHGETEKAPISKQISRLNSLTAIGDYYGGPSRLMVIDLPFVSIFMLMLFFVGGAMVLVPLLLFVIFAGLALRRNKELRAVLHDRANQDNKKYDYVTEVISGIQTVKAFAMEPQMQRRFERLQQSVAEITQKSIILGGSAQTAAVLYGNIAQITVVAIGAVLVIHGSLSMGALACCTLLSGQILQPLLRGISLWSEFESLSLKREEASELFAIPQETRATPIEGALSGTICLKDVVFSHKPGVSAPVIKGLSLTIPAGTIFGIRGGEGSGRSTLLRLIRGDLKPTSGSVTIDGVEASGEQADDLRQKTAYVGPHAMIFRASILDNIALFQRGMAREAACEAARLIGLEADIHQLPHGYETKLGDGISGDFPTAFLQRVAIARALARAPCVLVLDDANSVLDRRAEMALLRGLDALRGRMTIIIVSHRPSFIGASDMIVDLQAGQIVGITNKNFSTSKASISAPMQATA